VVIVVVAVVVVAAAAAVVAPGVGVIDVLHRVNVSKFFLYLSIIP
jgi:hypothetical protein